MRNPFPRLKTHSMQMQARTRRKIALERIHRLFKLAREMIHEDPALAQRYVDIARRIAMRVQVRLPVEYRRMVCRHCKGFIVPGVNCRVRIQPRREPHVVITCLRCGGHMRIPLRPRGERNRKSFHGRRGG